MIAIQLSEGLNAALDEFPNCDLIVYNAGTDLLAGDPLGRLNISYQVRIS